MTSPNKGPHMGFIRLALSDPEKRTLSQREIADRMREISIDNYPGVDSSSGPVAWSRASSRMATSRRSSSRCEATTSTELNDQSRPWPRSRAPCPAFATSTRRSTPTTGGAHRDRSRAGRPGRCSARTAAQTTLEATLGNINTPSVWIDPNNGQSYYVVTSYDADGHRTNALAQIPVRSATTESRARSARTARSRDRSVPSRSSATSSSARPTCSCRPKGATSGARRTSSRQKARDAIRAPQAREVQLRRPGRPDAHDVLRARRRARPGGHGRVHDHGAQFKSLRLPFVMLFTIPVSLVGIVGGADGRRAGLLHHRAHGRAHGRRHRGFERHPPRRSTQTDGSTTASTSRGNRRGGARRDSYRSR